MDPESVKDSLTKEQYRLYKLIWDRFVASQMAPAVYDTINADIEAGKYLFKASGSTVKFPGFTVLYQEDKDDETEEGEVIVPELAEGESLKLKILNPDNISPSRRQGIRKQAWLRLWKKKGIGRPSTYAPIITTILARVMW